MVRFWFAASRAARPFVLPVCSVGAWLSLVEHSVRDRGVGGSNPLAPTKIDQANRPSIDGHRRLKAFFVGDFRCALRESRKSFENMLDSESFMSGSRRPFSVDFG